VEASSVAAPGPSLGCIAGTAGFRRRMQRLMLRSRARPAPCGAASTPHLPPGEVPVWPSSSRGTWPGPPRRPAHAGADPRRAATIGEADAWRRPGWWSGTRPGGRPAPGHPPGARPRLARPSVILAAAAPGVDGGEGGGGRGPSAPARKPPRLANLVQVEYTVKTVPSTCIRSRLRDKPQGLMALVPPGDCCGGRDRGPRRRPAHAGGDPARARFVPSDCRSCEALVFGHADTGRIELVLSTTRPCRHPRPHPAPGGGGGCRSCRGTPAARRTGNPNAATKEVGESSPRRPAVPLLALRTSTTTAAGWRWPFR